MTFGSFLLLIFLAVVQSQSTPRGNFDAICPSQNNLIAEVGAGYHVRYHCNFLGPFGGNTLGHITSSEDCAARCRDAPACTGSTWNYLSEQCVLSGETRGRPFNGVLYMEVVDGESIPPEPTHSEQNDVGSTEQTTGPTDAFVTSIPEPHVRTCPVLSDRLIEPKLDPQVVEDPHCPNDNGNIFVADDGAHYTLLCCTHNPNGSSEIPNTRSTVSSLRGCASMCSSVSGCQSYVYSAKANSADAIGTCKLFSTGSFQTTECGDDTHDYAYIIAPPAIDSPDRANVACFTECPLSDGQQYKSKGGELFHIDCGKRHGTTVIHESVQENFQDCMDSCSRYIPCHSVDYHTNSKTCYFSNHHAEPEILARGFQSAHSLGCSGACDEDCAPLPCQVNTQANSN